MANPFQPGALVVAVLREPRERLWGRLLSLEGPGFALRGLELSPWEDILSLVRRGEAWQVALGTRFVPLHRLETLHLDLPSCGAPSLAQEFRDRSGMNPHEFLADDETEQEEFHEHP